MREVWYFYSGTPIDLPNTIAKPLFGDNFCADQKAQFKGILSELFSSIIVVVDTKIFVGFFL